MRLCGSDMDEQTTVLEAGLGWIVGWKKDDFLGADRPARAEGREPRPASSWRSRCASARSRGMAIRWSATVSRSAS